jgi:UDP:flavonoid glycosyltransferase YjiC (YdhE family)
VVYGGIPTPPNEREPVAWTPPWSQDGRPAVLLSLSTTYMHHEDLLQRLVDALGLVGCHALVTTGPGLGSRSLTRVPSDVHVVESAPHGSVLPHVGLVITHGGHGTVIRALAGGVPVMVVPISRDQPDNAARALYHQVGVKASKRSSPERFATVVRRALDDESLHACARQMAERLAPDTGAPKAVAALEDLAARHSRR